MIKLVSRLNSLNSFAGKGLLWRVNPERLPRFSFFSSSFTFPDPKGDSNHPSARSAHQLLFSSIKQSDLLWFSTNRGFHTINSTGSFESKYGSPLKSSLLSASPIMTTLPTDSQPFSTQENQEKSNNTVTGDKSPTVDPKDRKGRFKALIRDYGVTAVVFHVTISLASLGVCWLLVNSSLPMDSLFAWMGVDKKLGSMTEAASASTNFVIAYALHKSFALVRLSITAACVPVVVRFLRSKGILKPVASAVKKVN